jgi:rod shape-determining protein MreC
VKAENEELKRRIEELEGDQVRGDAAIQQLEEIATAEDLPITDQLPHVLARVVAGPVSSFEHTVEISKGAGDGIKVGMPVVTGAGLVGRVVQVTGGGATVQLVTDPNFEFGVRLVHNGEVGVARGTGDGRPLRVDSIDPKVGVLPGISVTTSEFARGILPPDVPVGVITEVNMSSDQQEQVLAVEPLANLGALSYVTVLIWEPPP